VLRSAGISARVIGDGADLSPTTQAALGWVVREATTNIIRHSDPTTVKIELDVVQAAGAAPTAVLRIENDGIRRPGPGGAAAMIRVLLADDENLIRSALAALLSMEDDLQVAAQAASGDEALAMARAHRPQVGGGRYVDPELAAEAISAGDSPLTPREADVLELAADGVAVEEIARRASLSPGTVRNYLSSAASKLGAANRHEAVHFARTHGWI
jgi:DNA-binding CsgD family transcriptional regulator